MTEHNRADDFTIGALVAELKAHREEFSRYRQESEQWRAAMEIRATAMEEFMNKMNTPLRIAWGGIAVIGVTMIGSLTGWLIHWFGKHWNP